jgi:hypothetical protein
MSQGDAVYAIHCELLVPIFEFLLASVTNPGSVAKTAGVCDKNSDSEVDSAITELVEDLSSTVCCNIVASSHHDESKYSRSNHESEALRTTPDIKDLSIRELPKSTDQT